MRSHDPYVRLLLDRILAGHGEVLQEFPLRPRSTRRADTATSAPRRAYSRASARPMPALAPVIHTTLPRYCCCIPAI